MKPAVNLNIKTNYYQLKNCLYATIKTQTSIGDVATVYAGFCITYFDTNSRH